MKRFHGAAIVLLIAATSCQNALLDKVKQTQNEAVSSKIVVSLEGAAAASGSTIEFPDTTIGASSSLALLIKNEGAATLTLRVAGLAIAGSAADEYSVTTNPAASLAVGASTTMVVSFSPAQSAYRTATLSIPTNDVTHESFALNLRGQGLETVPTVTTGAISSTSLTTATAAGTVVSDGGSAVTARGFCICEYPKENPTIEDTVFAATGTAASFSATLSELTAGNTYHVRAYATNAKGTGYGDDVAFVAGQCKVDFMVVDSIYETKWVTYKTPVSAPATDPTRTGYTLKEGGWFANLEGTIAYNFSTAVTADISIYSGWTANQYSIAFDANGGSGSMSAMTGVDYNSSVTLSLNTFTKDGCVFLGWSTTSTGSVEYEDEGSFTMAVTGATLYAVWEDRTVALTFTSVDGTAYSVTDCDGAAVAVIVPSNHGNLPVTAIGDNAFENCTSLASLSLPGGLTSLGASAFYGCTALTSLTVPSGVTAIGSSAFFNCSALTSITLQGTITSIGDRAFYYCSNLSTLTITMGSITSIPEAVFSNCSKLASFSIPSTVTSIGASAFSGCSILTGLTIPSGLTSLGDGAFANCYGLTSLTVPEGVTVIGSGTFSGCSGLTSLTIAGTITSLGASAFMSCSGLTSLTVSGTYTTIQGTAFYGCAKLASFTIPESVTSIYANAFNACAELTTITIPAAVASIGNYAFANCVKLATVSVNRSIALQGAITTAGTTIFMNGSALVAIYVPSADVTAYKTASGWSTYSTTVQGM